MNSPISKNQVLLLIAGLATINYFLIGGVFGTIGFNIGRAVIAAWGGWYIVSRAKSSLLVAALVGVIVLTVDHIIFKGGYFLLAQAVWPEAVENEGVMAFAGVLVSFVMFAPIAALISLAGGLLGRRYALHG